MILLLSAYHSQRWDVRWENGKQLVFYRLEELENLPKLAKELLEQEETMREIADCGYQYAKENLTWRQFVEELSGSLEGRND